MRSFYTHLNKVKSRCLVYHLTVINFAVSFTALPMMYCSGYNPLALTQSYISGVYILQPDSLVHSFEIFCECFRIFNNVY